MASRSIAVGRPALSPAGWKRPGEGGAQGGSVAFLGARWGWMRLAAAVGPAAVCLPSHASPRSCRGSGSLLPSDQGMTDTKRSWTETCFPFAAAEPSLRFIKYCSGIRSLWMDGWRLPVLPAAAARPRANGGEFGVRRRGRGMGTARGPVRQSPVQPGTALSLHPVPIIALGQLRRRRAVWDFPVFAKMLY